MRRAVVADEPGAVHREDHVELLQADVVDDLVEGALQEGRVDRAHRLGALQREPGGEQHRVLLGDADVEVAVGLGLLQHVEAGAGVHRGGDADDARGRARTSRTMRLAEDRRVLRRRGLRRLRRAGFGRGAGAPLAIDFGLAACHFSMPSRPPSSAGAKPLPLTVATWTTTGRSASSASCRPCAGRARRGRRHADVGPVELLPPQAGRPERLDRLLQLRAEPLERARRCRPAASSGRPRRPRARATASGSGGRG